MLFLAHLHRCAPGIADTAAKGGQSMNMVSEQIEARGVRMPSVLAAMRRVPRHCFVPEAAAGAL